MIFLYIPEQSVGAVIGSKGQNVKSIMQMSGARIKASSTDVCLLVSMLMETALPFLTRPGNVSSG